VEASLIGRAALPGGGGLLLLWSFPFSFLIRCFRPFVMDERRSHDGDLDLESFSETPPDPFESRVESASRLLDFNRCARLALRSFLICPRLSQLGDLDLEDCGELTLYLLVRDEVAPSSFKLFRLPAGELVLDRFLRLLPPLDDLDCLQLVDLDLFLFGDRLLARLSVFRVVALEENLDSNHFFFFFFGSVTTGIAPLRLEDSELGISLNLDLKFLGSEKDVELELPHLLLVHRVGWLFWGLR